jgi:hypothetical protein
VSKAPGQAVQFVGPHTDFMALRNSFATNTNIRSLSVRASILEKYTTISENSRDRLIR